MKKGFTLIELLAVIIILAVVALIVTPIVLDVVSDAKESARESKLKLYADNIKLKATENYFTKGGNIDGKVDISLMNDSSTSCDKAYYSNGKIYLSDCSVDGEDDFYYVDGDIQISEPANWNELIVGLSAPIVANAPELFDNMVAVRHDGTNWLVADTSTEWYNYDNKEWANAVVLNNGVTKAVGETVSESEISLWYVWIPRYKYTIFNGNNGIVSEQEINVVFESETSRTGTVTCTDNIGTQSTSEDCTDDDNGGVTDGVSTYTHPAFTLGDTELTGIWVGKFENSTSNATCLNTPNAGNCNKELNIKILPNVQSWRYAQVATFFTSIKKITSNYGITNADSHMMKNMEWGAVAYLTQSKYGRCTSGSCTEASINDSNSYYTGRSAGAPGSSSTTPTAAGTYTYETSQGQLASTTGNIYGIYDMSGGAYEYVMGNTATSSTSPIVGYNSNYTSNFSGIYTEGTTASGSYSFPDYKYTNMYSYDISSSMIRSRGKLGDATKETLIIHENNTGGWYRDYASFPYYNSIFFVRGGYWNDGVSAGVFCYSSGSGFAYSNNTTRSVLTPD